MQVKEALRVIEFAAGAAIMVDAFAHMNPSSREFVKNIGKNMINAAK